MLLEVPTHPLPTLAVDLCVFMAPWPLYRSCHVCVMAEICAYLPSLCIEELSPGVQSLKMVLVQELEGNHSRGPQLTEGGIWTQTSVHLGRTPCRIKSRHWASWPQEQAARARSRTEA